jgi:ATPase family associated with various cellular activities (AAA)
MESRVLQAKMSRLPTLTEDLHSDDEALLCPCELFAFVLRTRLWSVLHVDKLNNLEGTTNGFDGLVLPAGHKQTLLAMFECHIKGNNELLTARNSIDVVRGKGEGLVILLHGEPGVGKTSTAECIARYTRRPLLPMACGDLGASPEVVEVELMRILGLAQLWGAVLLLDEADVFLQRRDKGTSLSRNMIVSVFLRVLEYYKGILILTTNRVGTFDPAFKSRIHTALYYQRLDKKASLAVWKMHLDRLEESSAISVNRYREDILEFARDHYQKLEKSKATWNGRQIRNAFQTAIALAEYKSHKRQEGVSVEKRKKPRLTVEEFEKVAEASASFDLYLRRVYRGYDDGYIAKDNKERVDDEEPGMKPLFTASRRRRDDSDPEVEKQSDGTDREDTESASTGESDFKVKTRNGKGKKESKGKKNGS